MLEGYIIQMPYDEEIGSSVVVSVVPRNDFDENFVEKARKEKRILAVKTQLPKEDETDFRLRLDILAEKIRLQRQVKQNPNQCGK